jgi:hypothetical protein
MNKKYFLPNQSSSYLPRIENCLFYSSPLFSFLGEFFTNNSIMNLINAKLFLLNSLVLLPLFLIRYLIDKALDSLNHIPGTQTLCLALCIIDSTLVISIPFFLACLQHIILYQTLSASFFNKILGLGVVMGIQLAVQSFESILRTLESKNKLSRGMQESAQSFTV